MTTTTGAQSGLQSGTESSMSGSQSSTTGAEETYERMQHEASRRAMQVQQAGHDAAEGVRDVASNFADAFEESLRERPIATVGLVAVAGFVLGALWKS